MLDRQRLTSMDWPSGTVHSLPEVSNQRVMPPERMHAKRGSGVGESSPPISIGLA